MQPEIDRRIQPSPKDLTWLKTAHPREIMETDFEWSKQEDLPMFLVVTQDVELDEKNYEDRKKSIAKRGQAEPIGVRPIRLSDEEWSAFWNSRPPEIKDRYKDFASHGILYEIHNGFHRFSILQDLGIEIVKSTVWYNMSDEEFNDERVKASLDHTVKFSRLATWMNDAFKLSPWVNTGIRLDQIFSLAAVDGSGKILMNRFGLSPREIEDMKTWAINKAQEWKTNAGSMYQDLLIIVNIDPLLIKRIRTTGGGSHGRGELSTSRLREVAKILNRDTDPDYTLQNALASSIINNNLVADELKQIAPLVLRYKDDPVTLDMLLQDPRNVSEELLKYIEEEQMENLLDELTENGEADHPDEVSNIPPEYSRDHSYSTRRDVGRVRFPILGKGSSKAVDYNRRFPTSEDLQRENEILRQEVTLLSKRKFSGELALLTTPGITDIERRIVHLFFVGHHSLPDIASQMRLTQNQVEGYLTSIINKYNIYLAEEQLKSNLRK